VIRPGVTTTTVRIIHLTVSLYKYASTETSNCCGVGC
jgi:hypothetical protein